jgi:hypothetical protein
MTFVGECSQEADDLFYIIGINPLAVTNIIRNIFHDAQHHFDRFMFLDQIFGWFHIVGS